MRTSCFFLCLWQLNVSWPSTCYCLKAQPTFPVIHPFPLSPLCWLVEALCLHNNSSPHDSCRPVAETFRCHFISWSFYIYLKMMLSWMGLQSLKISSGFCRKDGSGKAFWLDYNFVFWVSQAASAIHWTDPNGVTTKWNHPNTCAHTGTKLSAYQTESLQQPNHHSVWLSQVSDPYIYIYACGRLIYFTTYTLQYRLKLITFDTVNSMLYQLM